MDGPSATCSCGDREVGLVCARTKNSRFTMLRRSKRSVFHTHAISMPLLLDRREESISDDELAMSCADGNLGGEGERCAPSCKHVQRRCLAAGTIASVRAQSELRCVSRSANH